MTTATLLFGVAVIPAIVGLTQVAKDAGIPSTFAPGIAVVLGILAGLAQLYAGTWPWIQAVVLGITFGLSACGLYAGAKTVGSQLFNSSASQPVTTVPPAPTTDPTTAQPSP